MQKVAEPQARQIEAELVRSFGGGFRRARVGVGLLFVIRTLLARLIWVRMSFASLDLVALISDDRLCPDHSMYIEGLRGAYDGVLAVWAGSFGFGSVQSVFVPSATKPLPCHVEAGFTCSIPHSKLCTVTFFIETNAWRKTLK